MYTCPMDTPGPTPSSHGLALFVTHELLWMIDWIPERNTQLVILVAYLSLQRMDMRVDMCVDTCEDVCVDVCTDIGIDRGTDMQ